MDVKRHINFPERQVYLFKVCLLLLGVKLYMILNSVQRLRTMAFIRKIRSIPYVLMWLHISGMLCLAHYKTQWYHVGKNSMKSKCDPF